MSPNPPEKGFEELKERVFKSLHEIYPEWRYNHSDLDEFIFEYDMKVGFTKKIEHILEKIKSKYSAWNATGSENGMQETLIVSAVKDYPSFQNIPDGVFSALLKKEKTIDNLTLEICNCAPFAKTYWNRFVHEGIQQTSFDPPTEKCHAVQVFVEEILQKHSITILPKKILQMAPEGMKGRVPYYDCPPSVDLCLFAGWLMYY